LKELSEKYEDAENKVKKMKRDVTDSWNSFPALKAKTEKYQRQVEAAEKRREMKDEMARIQGQLAWSYVIEREGVS
jgi:outer membrane protein TolC